MNALLKQLQNVRVRQVICYCDVHHGDTLQQLDAELPDGRPIAILEDWRGLHVAIGKQGTIGKFPYTQPVTEQQAAQMIREAMQ